MYHLPTCIIQIIFEYQDIFELCELQKKLSSWNEFHYWDQSVLVDLIRDCLDSPINKDYTNILYSHLTMNGEMNEICRIKNLIYNKRHNGFKKKSS